MPWTRRLLLLAGCALLIAAGATACTPRGLTPADMPTPITDLDGLATADFMTQNAPPPRFRDVLRLPRIDQGLERLDGWRYVVTLEFDGVFADTPRPATASTTAEVSYALLGTERRVVLEAQGPLLVAGDAPEVVEGVRLGADTFVVREGACTPTTGQSAQAVADLGAGDLIGGVLEAVPDGHRAVINGAEVWRYAFLQDALDLSPSIQLSEGGRVTLLSGELWFAPAHEAAVRFYLVLDVERAVIFGSQLPVSGQVVMRYDLFDVGTDPNISVPFGC